MVWKDYIVKQFSFINRSTTRESDFFGAYPTLLFDVFPPSEFYLVAPQFRRNVGSVDYTISYVVLKNSQVPIFFVEIRTFVALNLGSARAVADKQMRRIFLDFSLEPLPSKLIGISAMGTRYAVYEYTTNDHHLNPPRIIHHPHIVTDTAPKERWSDDIMEDSGEAKFRALVNEAKEMASAFGEVCEYFFLCHPRPFTDLHHRTWSLWFLRCDAVWCNSSVEAKTLCLHFLCNS
jgi:hypothetical protein